MAPSGVGAWSSAAGRSGLMPSGSAASTPGVGAGVLNVGVGVGVALSVSHGAAVAGAGRSPGSLPVHPAREADAAPTRRIATTRRTAARRVGMAANLLESDTPERGTTQSVDDERRRGPPDPGGNGRR